MVFSSRRIKGPKEGLLAMHPFVDVLEGRELFSGSVHEGVFSVDDPTGAAAPVSAAASAPAAYGLDGASFFASGARISGSAAKAALAEDPHLPAVINVRPAQEGSAFSSTTIENGDAALFGNLFHDRRGRSAPRLHVEPEAQHEPAGAFRDGRSLTGAMRPFVTMSVVGEEYPFAA